jgi:hypothetical protein
MTALRATKLALFKVLILLGNDQGLARARAAFPADGGRRPA